MADINFDYHPRFFTATILQWKHLLKEDEYKDIIIGDNANKGGNNRKN